MAIVPIESYARLLLGKSESRGGRGGTRRRGGLLSGSRFRRRLDLLSIYDPDSSWWLRRSDHSAEGRSPRPPRLRVNLPLLFVNCISRGSAEVTESPRRRDRLNTDPKVLACGVVDGWEPCAGAECIQGVALKGSDSSIRWSLTP